MGVAAQGTHTLLVLIPSNEWLSVVPSSAMALPISSLLSYYISPFSSLSSHSLLTITLPLISLPSHSPTYLPLLLTLTLTLDILRFSSPSLSHFTPPFSPSLSHLSPSPPHPHPPTNLPPLPTLTPTYLPLLLTLTLPLGTLPPSRGTRNPLNKVLEAYREVEAYRTMFRLPCDELLDCYTDCLMYAPSSKSNIVGRLFLSRRYLCFGSKVSGGWGLDACVSGITTTPTTPSHTLSHSNTPTTSYHTCHTLTRLTPFHTLSHPLTPYHTLSHPVTPTTPNHTSHPLHTYLALHRDIVARIQVV